MEQNKELKAKATELYLIQELSTAVNTSMIKLLFSHLCMFDPIFRDECVDYLNFTKDGLKKMLEQSKSPELVNHLKEMADKLFEEFEVIAATSQKIAIEKEKESK